MWTIRRRGRISEKNHHKFAELLRQKWVESVQEKAAVHGKRGKVLGTHNRTWELQVRP